MKIGGRRATLKWPGPSERERGRGHDAKNKKVRPIKALTPIRFMDTVADA
ncbi:MAG TPA: hypothetical protein VGR51_05125 [Thermoplasmata archaeon]|jgi:hypothetical protein|nr:hypothetical protein [Thermoplasmata archaeon]